MSSLLKYRGEIFTYHKDDAAEEHQPGTGQSEAVLGTAGSLLMWFKAPAIFLSMNRTGLTAPSGTLWQPGFIQA